jgi:selenocysteine lyase/cysteine desulfurase
VFELGFETVTPKDNLSPLVSFTHGRDAKHLKHLFEHEAIDVTFREENDAVIRAGIALVNNNDDIHRSTKILQTIALRKWV